MAEKEVVQAFLLSLINVFCMSYAILACGKKKQRKQQSAELVTKSAKTLPPVPLPLAKVSEKPCSAASGSDKPLVTGPTAPQPDAPATASQTTPNESKEVQKEKAPEEKAPQPASTKADDKKETQKSELKGEKEKPAPVEPKKKKLSELVKKPLDAAEGPRGMEIHKSVKVKKEAKKDVKKSERTQQSVSAKKEKEKKEASPSKKEKPKAKPDAQEIFEDDEEEDETMRGIQSLTKDPNIPSSVDE